jgi:asparagine synthase (glutamine-hydrolysing)
MAHRGPDDESVLVEPGVALGGRRLAIIDVAGGQQPVWNEDQSVAVFMNGEIYNYLELREELRGRGHTFRTNSDTEVIAHLYEESGTDLCRDLRGMFAFAVWDRPRRRLLLGRDRFGKKPLYKAVGPGGVLVFASELNALRPLARAAGLKEEVSREAVWDYLSAGVVLEPSTIWKDVSALEPATVITWEEGHTGTPRRYWKPVFEPKLTIAYEEAQEELRRRLREAVRLRLRSDVPVGLFLSGGMDSGSIAAEVAAVAGGNVSTYTVSVEDPNLDEAEPAQTTARMLGLPNEILRLNVAPNDAVQYIATHWGQPFADSSAIPNLAVSRLARQRVTVILNGDGGDEVLAGYRRYIAAYFLDRLPSAVQSSGLRRVARLLLWPKLRRTALGFGLRWTRGLGVSPASRYLVWTTDLFRDEEKKGFWLGDRMRPTEELFGSLIPPWRSEVDRLVGTDLSLNLLSDLLVKMDMATMAASLEGRSPFLDHKVAEFCFALPVNYRLRNGRGKAILRDAYRGRLPKQVLAGKKKGFEVPLEAWLKKDLAPMLNDLVLGPDSRVANWVDRRFLLALLKMKAISDGNLPGRVYCLLMLELWLRQLAEAAD